MFQESSIDEHDYGGEEAEEEMKTMKQHSPSLSTNDDLRELCLLLNEERQKMHELAEQWKQFGTNTIHNLECQIVEYQEKLTELEQRQTLLVRENQSLKSLIDPMLLRSDADEYLSTDRKVQQNVSTQTNLDKQHSSHRSCFHRPKSVHEHLSRATATVHPRTSINKLTREMSIDDPLQQQISIQNMFDAIKTAEVYESIEDITGDNDQSEKKLLKEFCNLIWKYLEDRSKPKSSCLL